MKKSILAIGLVALSLSAFAQGTFNGKNSGTLSPLLGADGLKLPTATGRFEILSGSTLLSTAKNTLTAAGIFGAGVLTVPSVAAGGTASITVRAWDTSAGATYAAAFASGAGFATTTFDVVGLGGGLATPPAMDNFKGLTLGGAVVIPEPTTIALAALGLGGLLFVSRRK